MSGPLAVNPSPEKLDVGSLGTWYVSGAVSALYLWQDYVDPGDRRSILDLDNGQVFVQKVDGVVQFFAQAGTYSLPALGSAYVRSDDAISDFYGALPVAFVKLVPNSAWSIEVGKLPTLIGAEYTFTYENMNIERGLLWNQEPAISRGVQVNYTQGPVALSLSWNDGYYSDRYSTISGAATWTINSSNTLEVCASGNTRTTGYSSFATPLYQNNGAIYNVMYTHTQGAWTVSPYFQYSEVPSSPIIGTGGSASTTGAALLVNYAFDSKAMLGPIPLNGVNLSARVEYISTTGSESAGAANLLYGVGSSAGSLTITPSYQYKIFFARAEASIVHATGITPGDGFGPNGTNHFQDRILFETGILF